MGNYLVFFTYVMMSERDNKLYIGFTNDLEKRVEEHHKGVVPSTANRRPL
ncbi:MAG: GIY-YIG nuclease family protein, partial [Desulfobacteraceae bacterium]|nr:GIY-YIG nuclease family protein [Desulfobacteraceae bacterium]